MMAKVFEAVGLGDLGRLVTDDAFALNARDRFVVPLMTVLSYKMSGMEPELMVAFSMGTLGMVLYGATLVGFCGGGKARVGSLLVSASAIGFAMWSVLYLKTPAVDQRLELYGKQPFRTLADLPTLPAIGPRLVCDEEHFRDEQGRVLLLRGVNLGGDTKVPTSPDGATWRKREFYDTETVSFVGRPFPLEEADEHLGRLRSWGFTFLRFLVTWEAIEHAGPGQYDTKYIEYVQAVVRKCAEHGISVFIDPHQDVWSRWTGGDGAPAWTLTKVGFELQNLYKSGAAVTHQEHGDPFPQMVWPTNYNRLAAATMFTLFFAGNTFAPNTLVDGQPVQDFLQSHYINAVAQLAEALKNEPNVLGYDTLNEPSTGFAGLQDLNTALFPAPMGWFLSGFACMTLGAGVPREVPFFSSPMIFSRFDLFNSDKALAWQSHAHDIWRNEGVWELDQSGVPRLLRPDHFARNKAGEPVHFMRDFMSPFFERFKKRIHAAHPDSVIFAEPYIDPNSPVHDTAPSNVEGNRYAWAPHYYDAMTLILKKARPWIALDIQLELPVFSSGAAQRAITRNLGHVKEMGRTLGGKPGGGPVLLGEIGISMDLDRDASGMARAYKTGDFSAQINVLDRTLQGLEANLLSFTLWNYAAKNNNKRGDLWNDEDLSLYSRDQQTESKEANLHSGGRALQAAVRPYPMKTRGIPKLVRFEPLAPKRPFRFEFEAGASDDPADAPTIIFVPTYQYPNGVNCTVSDGTFEYDRANQHIVYKHDHKAGPGLHSVSLTMA